MKIYIFADMEGASGICNASFVEADKPLYQAGCKYMAGDVNACIAGCFKAGATEVVVRDGHCTGVNMRLEDIDPRASLIQGDSGLKRFHSIEGSDAIIFLCYHAMAGTHAAVLEHTFSSSSIQNMWIGGDKVGEFAIDSSIAAEYGVPTIMVSGDDKACEEAGRWLPSVVKCQVKEGLASHGAKLLPFEKAHALIERAAIKAIGGISKAKLRRPAKGVSLRLETVERCAPKRPEGAKLIDARTVEISGKSLEKLLFALL